MTTLYKSASSLALWERPIVDLERDRHRKGGHLRTRCSLIGRQGLVDRREDKREAVRRCLIARKEVAVGRLPCLAVLLVPNAGRIRIDRQRAEKVERQDVGLAALLGPLEINIE